MTLRLVLACDPGISGAIGVVADGCFFEVLDLPTRMRRTGKQEIDARTLAAQLRMIRAQHVGAAEVFLVEDVSPMPSKSDGAGMGSTSAFQYGRGLGMVEGVVEALGLPVVRVHAAKWKSDMGLRGTPKDYARTIAMQKFPEAADLLKRKKDIGRADALLIAAWGVEHEATGKPQDVRTAEEVFGAKAP